MGMIDKTKAAIYKREFTKAVSDLNMNEKETIRDVVDKNFKPGERRTIELFVFPDGDRKKQDPIFYICLELFAYQIRILPVAPEKATCSMEIFDKDFQNIKFKKTTFEKQFMMGELNVTGEYWVRDYLIFDKLMKYYVSNPLIKKRIELKVESP